MLDQNARLVKSFVSERKKRRSSQVNSLEDSVKRMSLSKMNETRQIEEPKLADGEELRLWRDLEYAQKQNETLLAENESLKKRTKEYEETIQAETHRRNAVEKGCNAVLDKMRVKLETATGEIDRLTVANQTLQRKLELKETLNKSILVDLDATVTNIVQLQQSMDQSQISGGMASEKGMQTSFGALTSPIAAKAEGENEVSFLQHTVHSLYRPLINSDMVSL